MKKIEIPRIFYCFFWKNLYYDIKWGIWALIKYFRVVTKMRPWDSDYILEMMRFQLGVLKNNLENYKLIESSPEEIKNINRAIELLKNKLEDDFLDRCGYEEISDKIKLQKIEEKNQYEFVYEEGIEEKYEKIIKDSSALEEKEWNELIELLKSMRNWWN
jgi:hypothetical protein